MPIYDYVSLHNHSDCSLLDGLGTIAEYVDRTVDLKQKALGLTDHGNGHGIFEFMQKTKDAGVTGVPGVEFYVAPENPDGARVKEKVFYGGGGDFDVAASGAYLHLTVWAYNETGLHNLFILLSESNNPDHYYMKPRIDTEMLLNHSEGLIVSTGCPSSEVSTRLLLGQTDKAYEYAGRLKDVFGDRLFVEIMNHHMPSRRGKSIEDILLPKQLELAQKLQLPLLATNDSHYARPEDYTTHEEFLCMQSGAKMSDEVYDNGGNRFAFSGNEYYLRETHEMNKIFPDQDFPNAIKNTLLVAEMAQDLKLSFNAHLKPTIDLGENPAKTYEQEVLKGLRWRYGDSKILKRENPELFKKICRSHKEEMDTIYSSDFMGYMLVVRDYIKYARDNHSVRDNSGQILASAVGTGRGSAAGSLHAYALGITNVDPIKHELMFSRFLSPGRGATQRIHYTDGTYEDLLVSDVLSVRDSSGRIETKYAHEISAGDIVTSKEWASWQKDTLTTN